MATATRRTDFRAMARDWAAGRRELGEPGNLLGLKVGDGVAIDDPDFGGGGPATVGAIRAIAESAGGRTHRIAEYELAPAPDPAAGAGAAIAVWVYEPEAAGGGFRAIAFREAWAGGYGDAMREGLYHPGYDAARGGWCGPHSETAVAIPALQDPGGLFYFGEARYRRRGGDVEPHAVTIAAMADADGDGRVAAAEVERYDARYWDYDLEPGRGDGEPFLFVVEAHNGRFRVLAGREVPLEAVTLFR